MPLSLDSTSLLISWLLYPPASGGAGDGGCGQSVAALLCCFSPWSSLCSSRNGAQWKAALASAHDGEFCSPPSANTLAPAPHIELSSKSWCHFIFILWNSMIQFCVLKWCFTPSVLILWTPSWHVRSRRGLARALTPVCFTPCSLLPFLLFQMQFSPLWQLSTVLRALKVPFFSGIISETPSVSSMFI